MNCPRCQGSGQLPDVPSGEELRAIREKLKLNQREMGARLGCSRTAVHWWERGIQVPSPQRVAQYKKIRNQNG